MNNVRSMRPYSRKATARPCDADSFVSISAAVTATYLIAVISRHDFIPIGMYRPYVQVVTFYNVTLCWKLFDRYNTVISAKLRIKLGDRLLRCLISSSDS